MDAFRRAIEAEDLEALAATLADDVVFRSPVAHKSYVGKDKTMVILRNVMQVFGDFTYTRVIGEEGGRDWAYVFEAKVGERTVTGCDFLHLNDKGRIDEFMVMIRPLSGVIALAEAMGARTEVQHLNELA